MKRLLLVLAGLFQTACAQQASDRPTPSTGPHAARNVILFVADGAGVGHWSLALLENPDLVIQEFVHTGFVDTRGSDHIVSGSGPGATALATGQRSYMGAISVDADGNHLETVLERAMALGKSTGLMTTTAIFDATPAAFAAHAVRRSRFEEITRQMVRKDVNVLMGGGRRYFLGDQRRDSIDLLTEIRNGYTYVETGDELSRIDLQATTHLFGLFADGDMGPAAGRDPSLAEMTKSAIEVLAQDADGFFLMVETEETDTQAHNNEPLAKLMEDMMALNEAIAVALDFQSDNPETLIVITSDHETGGITLLPDSVRNPVLNYSTGGHTGVWVPLFAKGPGASNFTGVLANQEVGRRLIEAVGVR